MDSLPITLIVKAPNQLIEDQTIQCESTWSVKTLKEHLSQVYPNKPHQNEQKLIYSGQLLNDNIILKDVLREYGGPQRIHTLHLVCTPKCTKSAQKAQAVPVVAENTENAVNDLPSTTINNAALNSAVYETVPHGNWYNNANYSTHQFMLMQQTYLQYMQHYMNIAHLQRFGAPMPGLSGQLINEYNNNRLNQQEGPRVLRYENNVAGDAAVVGDVEPLGVNMGVAPLNDGAVNAAAAFQQPQQFVARDQGAVGDPLIPAPPAQAQQLRAIGLNDDRDHRDWLDHFYMVCRIMIFISIVYLYSSATRFIVVFFTAICLYLYQIGFFRNVNVNNNDINANERRPREGALAARGAPPVPGAPFPAGLDGTDEVYLLNQERQPSRLTVAWTFVTTFLASLLPEIPNVV